MPDFLSPLFAWEIAGGLSIAGLLALAYWIPWTRKYAIAAGIFIAGLLTIYRKGYKDASGKWDDAIARDIEKGSKARDAAERAVDTGRVRDDEYNRDRKKGRL